MASKSELQVLSYVPRVTRQSADRNDVLLIERAGSLKNSAHLINGNSEIINCFLDFEIGSRSGCEQIEVNEHSCSNSPRRPLYAAMNATDVRSERNRPRTRQNLFATLHPNEACEQGTGRGERKKVRSKPLHFSARDHVLAAALKSRVSVVFASAKAVSRALVRTKRRPDWPS